MKLGKYIPRKMKIFFMKEYFPEETNLLCEALCSNSAQDNNVMFDIGAGYGSTFEPFAAANWKVYGFEPDSDNMEIAQITANKYDDVYLDKRAVSNKNEKDIPFYRSNVSAGISGMS